MSGQNPRIKKVIDTLAEGSASVRNNPSEQNYQEYENKLERAGKNSNWKIYAAIAGAIVIFLYSMVQLSYATPSGTSYIIEPTSVYVQSNAIPTKVAVYATNTHFSTSAPILRATITPSDVILSSLTLCLADTAPARKGPGTSYIITEWVQKNECLRFDGRYSAQDGIWLRIQKNQEGIYFLGNSWIRSDKLKNSYGEIDSLPIVSP